MLTSKKAYKFVNCNDYLQEFKNITVLKNSTRGNHRKLSSIKYCRYKKLTNINQLQHDLKMWYLPCEYYICISKDEYEAMSFINEVKHGAIYASEFIPFCVHRVQCAGASKKRRNEIYFKFIDVHKKTKNGTCTFNHAYINEKYKNVCL